MLIDMLLRLMNSGAGLAYMSTVRRYRDELREKVQDNLNMRIKAWVLMCPARIEWVRQIIGEAAIRKWQKNRLADYALSKYFGDWQTKFPNGFTRDDSAEIGKPPRIIVNKTRAYNWKPFTLVKIANIERILFGQNISKPVADTAIEGMCKWQHASAPHMRAPRAMKPVEFTPHELVPAEVSSTVGVVEDGKHNTVRKKIRPPLEHKKLASKNLESKKAQEPEVDKPP